MCIVDDDYIIMGPEYLKPKFGEGMEIGTSIMAEMGLPKEVFDHDKNGSASGLQQINERMVERLRKAMEDIYK